jgi:hypothetical protein
MPRPSLPSSLQDAIASYKRPGHQEVRAELVHHWGDLGWRPLRLPRGVQLSSHLQFASTGIMSRAPWPPN